MNSIISEKDYPVQFRWVFKSSFGAILALVVLGSFWFVGLSSPKTNSYIVFIAIFLPFNFIFTVLQRNNFRYEVEEKFLNLYQGVLSKKQRHIPYGVIQNIFVKQDLFDRVFGLASVTIENASQGGGSVQAGETKVFGMKVRARERHYDETVGFTGNKVRIPGLTQEDAEALKEAVLKKMKENPIEDNQSGL